MEVTLTFPGKRFKLIQKLHGGRHETSECSVVSMAPEANTDLHFSGPRGASKDAWFITVRTESLFVSNSTLRCTMKTERPGW